MTTVNQGASVNQDTPVNHSTEKPETISTPESISLRDAILARRSVRGYLPERVPAAILEGIFTLAQHAPSNCNIQPWKVYVASGEVKDRLRTAMVDRVTSGVPFNSDYDYPNTFAGEYRRRQLECAMALYEQMGIERADKEGRMHAVVRNYEMFDAPHVCFIGMNKNFGASVAIDVGMYIQNLLLAMTAYGVSSCPQGTMRYYPDLVREAFAIDEDTYILLGISFGYEDTRVPANRTRVGRDPLAASVVFKG